MRIRFGLNITIEIISQDTMLEMVDHPLHYERPPLTINYTTVVPLDLQKIFNFYCFLSIV